MNTLNVSKYQATLIKAGYKYAVVVWYDYGARNRGDVISMHRDDRTVRQAIRRNPGAGHHGIVIIDPSTDLRIV